MGQVESANANVKPPQDALTRFMHKPMFDFLEPSPSETVWKWAGITAALIVVGFTTACIGHSTNSRFLRKTSQFIWVGGLLSFLWVGATGLPRESKFMICFVLSCLGIPFLLIFGTFVVFGESDKDAAERKAREAKEAELEKSAQDVVDQKDDKGSVSKGKKSSTTVGGSEQSRLEEPEVITPPVDGS